MATVREIMTANVATVPPTMGIKELAEFFVQRGISGAPVVDEEGALLGVVLEEGLIIKDSRVHVPTVMNVLFGFVVLGEKRFEDEIQKIAALTVAGIMDHHPHVLSPDDTIEDVATHMLDKNIWYYPVAEQGKLIGVVTKK